MNSHSEDSANSGKARDLSMRNLDAQVILKTMRQPLIVLDRELIVQGANKAFYHTFEVEPDETEGLAIYDLGNGQWDISKLRELLTDILPNSGTVEDFMVVHRFEGIGRRIMMINARQVPEHDPDVILLAIDDVTQQEDMRSELEWQKELAEMTIDAAPMPFLVLGEDLRVQKANETFYDTFKVDRAETIGHLVFELGNNQWDIPKLRELLEDVLPKNTTVDDFEVEHDFEGIGHRLMVLNARRIDHLQLILLAIDLTAQRLLERTQFEEADRRSFILNLVDRLRREKNPEALVEVTCEALGHRFDADQVVYSDINISDSQRVLSHVWSKQTEPDLPGQGLVEGLGRPLLDQLKEGQTLVIENVFEDARTRVTGLFAPFDEITVASLLYTPLIEDGQLRAILGVQFTKPQQWLPADVKLTAEVVERLWDTVARFKAEVELGRSLRKFRVLVESGAQATWEMGPEGRSITDPTSWCAYTGQTVEEALGDGWLDAIYPDDRELVALRWHQYLQAPEPLSEEYRLRHGDVWRWSQVRAAPVRDGAGHIIRWVGMNHDITDRKEAEERVEHMALYDALTGLPNRWLLQDRFREAVARTHREESDLGIVMLDVDRFKEVNDTVGHVAGDKVLQSVADRVNGAIRSDDTFARLSGDEFVAVLPNVSGVAEIERLAERIRDAVNQPLSLGERSLTLSASMGIVLFSQDGDDLESLLHCADLALYHAKAKGRNTSCFFEPEMEAEMQRLRRTEADLGMALERDELTLFYQPQLDLSDGRIRSVEALVRWRHPTRGLLSPDEFIPVAESTGLIHPLGHWVINEACRQVREWSDQGLDLRVGINISAAEAQLDGVLKAIDRAFAAYRLGRKDVEIELTESLLVDPTNEPMAILLAGLQERGVGVSMDDFGTGYSSFSYLKDLPIDTIKIDRAFIAWMDTRDGQILLKAIIDLGHWLGKKIIVEGVETDDQLSWLKASGCDTIQGFRIGRPMAPDQISKLDFVRLCGEA